MQQLIPDVVVEPSISPWKLMARDAALAAAGAGAPGAFAAAALAVAPAITDIEMRIHGVKIIRNGAWGSGNVYVAAVVADDLADEPIQVQVQPFAGVRDGDELPIGPAGMAIYRNLPQGVVPRFLDYRILIAESDDNIRQAGEILGDLQADDSFQALTRGLVAAATPAAPLAPLIRTAANLAISLLARILKMNQDDQLALIAGSFNRMIDALGTGEGMITHTGRSASVRYQVHQA